MMKKVIFLGPLFLLLTFLSQAQQYAQTTFEGTRIINGHSVKMNQEGELDFLISHRFGRLNGGFYELFGLDQATIRFGLEYGLKDWLNIGVGRSSWGKHYDVFGKLRLIQQSDQMPVSVVAFSSVAINTLRPSDPELPVPIQTRLAYTSQLLIARKFGDRLSLQMMPSWVHYNLVETPQDANDVFSIGGAARIQLSKTVGFILEYYYTLPGQLTTEHYNPIGIGFDIKTGSHVFQLHFTNANAMIEKGFIGETSGNFWKGDIHMGFNISRTFKLKGRRY